MKKPDPVINLKVLRRKDVATKVNEWLSCNKTWRAAHCPFSDCKICCQLFGVDDFFVATPNCPCSYYGPRKTYLAVKKAVKEIEKEVL